MINVIIYIIFIRSNVWAPGKDIRARDQIIDGWL